jgi:hypothetical protein
VGELAHQDSSPPSGPDGQGATVADLAVEMRTAVTPVIGYLELISEGDVSAAPDRHLDWIATIERRLEAIHELNDQIARICVVLKESASEGVAAINGREAATPRGPEARGD